MPGFILEILPDQVSRWLMAIGAGMGAVVSFLFGDLSDSVVWLFIFIVADYLSGTIAAMKTGTWNSRTGMIGITKKIVVLALVALCHGLDQASVIPFISLRDVSVFAFVLNDFGSILENLEKMGYGSVIPAPLRKALAAMEKKSEEMAESLEGRHE